MTCRETIWGYLSKICPNWHICATNTLGSSGVLPRMWNPNIFKFKSYKTYFGIIITGGRHITKTSFRIMNIYAPYDHQKDLWNKAAQSGLLDLNSIILAEDLNLITNPTEQWGQMSRPYPLEDYFHVFFMDKGLTDTSPNPIGPTWHNGSSGILDIPELLDHFLLQKYTIRKMKGLTSTIIHTKISDHFPSLLNWMEIHQNKAPSIKFNNFWHKEMDYIELVKSFWKTNAMDVEDIQMD